MKKHYTKSRSVALLYAIFVVMGTFSIIHGWFPQLHRLVFLCFAMVALSAIIAPRFFTTRSFFLIILYAIVVYQNFLWGDAFTEGKEVLDALTLASCGSMSYYFLASKDQINSRFLLYACLMVILVDTVGTLIMYMVNPEIVRFVQGIANGGDNISTLDFYKYGLVEYDVLHGLPVLIPPLVMWVRYNDTKKSWKLIAWLALIIIFVLLYIGDATTPFLLAILALVLSFMIVKSSHKKSVQRLILVSVISLPFLLFGDSVKNGILDSAYNITSGELQKKIDDTRQMNKSKELEGDADVRYGKYESSYDAFLRNPIIGTNAHDSLGGHSAFFDRLGAFGFLGTIPWLLVFISLANFNYRYIPFKARDFFLVGLFCFAMLLLLKNMSTFYTWFTFVVLMPVMFSLEIEKK